VTLVAGAPTAGSRLWVQWTLSNRGRSTVVSFAGEIDAANADHLVDTVGAVLETCRERLIVDLTAVGFVDAVGASALLRARQLASARAVHLDVVCAERVPRRVLTVPGDDEQIEFFGSVAEALGAQRSCELSGGSPTDR
jgi:anti-anti-sigma factor